MPQVCSGKSSQERKLWLQERMASLEVVPRKSNTNLQLYNRVHYWLKYYFKKPKRCFACRRSGLIDWACIGKYEKNIKNFKALCKSCHRTLDTNGGFTHCRRGHAMTKQNTYKLPNSYCIECIQCKRARQMIMNNRAKNKNKDGLGDGK